MMNAETLGERLCVTYLWTMCPRISVAESRTASRFVVELGSRDLTTASTNLGRLLYSTSGFFGRWNQRMRGYGGIEDKSDLPYEKDHQLEDRLPVL